MEEYFDLKIETWSKKEQVSYLFKKAEVFNEKYPKGTVLRLINLFSEDTFCEIPLFVDSAFVVDIKRKRVIFLEKYQRDIIDTTVTEEDRNITKQIAKEMGKLNV